MSVSIGRIQASRAKTPPAFPVLPRGAGAPRYVDTVRAVPRNHGDELKRSVSGLLQSQRTIAPTGDGRARLLRMGTEHFEPISATCSRIVESTSSSARGTCNSRRSAPPRPANDSLQVRASAPRVPPVGQGLQAVSGGRHVRGHQPWRSVCRVNHRRGCERIPAARCRRYWPRVHFAGGTRGAEALTCSESFAGRAGRLRRRGAAVARSARRPRRGTLDYP